MDAERPPPGVPARRTRSPPEADSGRQASSPEDFMMIIDPGPAAHDDAPRDRGASPSMIVDVEADQPASARGWALSYESRTRRLERCV